MGLGFCPEIPIDVTRFCRISRGEALFCLLSEISKGKMTYLKFQGSFSKNHVLNTPVWIFSGIAQCIFHFEIYSHLRLTHILTSNTKQSVEFLYS